MNAPIPLVQKNNNGEIDYDKLDRPTVIRHQKDNNKPPNFISDPNKEMDLDYLDIPAFLGRRKVCCAALTQDEIGGGTTDITVYTEGVIRHAGNQVTNDIVVALRTPTQHAEDIKK